MGDISDCSPAQTMAGDLSDYPSNLGHMFKIPIHPASG
jgi:hypothetical protein